MNKALLDTDIYSEVLKAKNPTVAQNAALYRRQHGVYTVSVITVMEVVQGFLILERCLDLDELLVLGLALVVSEDFSDPILVPAGWKFLLPHLGFLRCRRRNASHRYTFYQDERDHWQCRGAKPGRPALPVIRRGMLLNRSQHVWADNPGFSR